MQVIIMHKVINQSIEISKILGVAKSLIFYKEGMHWPVEGQILKRTGLRFLLQPNVSDLIRQRCTEQMDYDPKRAARPKKEFFKAEKCDIFQQLSQSSDFNPIEHAFQLLNTNLKRLTNKLHLRVTAEHLKGVNNACDDVHGLETSGSFIEVLKTILMFKMMLVCPITPDALKRFIKMTVIPKQFMENFPKLLELNLKVYTSVTH